MGRACCVLGCPSGGDAPSHHIPRNPILFHKWKSVIYSEKMKNMTDQQISKCAVCYRHFADDDYLLTFRVRKLKRGVIPSLNLSNISATYNGKLNTDKTGTVESASDASLKPLTHVEKEITLSEKEITESHIVKTEISETTDSVLFEDLPDDAELYLKHLQLNNKNEHMEQIHLTEDALKLYYQNRILRRKRAKLVEQQLTLLRYKKQAEHYKKTFTIQKLLSFLTPDEIESVKTKIRKSRYSPKTYVKEYHKIAKQRVLGQL